MNCERCQELLSDFIDGALHVGDAAHVGRHLDGCAECSTVRDELAEIVGAARQSRLNFVAPPSERALWLRIRNTIEADERAEAEPSVAAAAAGAGFWSRFSARRWSFTLPQLATVSAAVVVAVSLATALGMRSVLEGRRADESRKVAPVVASQFQPGADEMMVIEYLKQRVEQRKGRWDPRMRDAFDRNMSVIDATVDEMLQELNRRPHDEVSEDALNEAMRNKIELLKEFAEL
jgi:anti-sigma factor RsiW